MIRLALTCLLCTTCCLAWGEDWDLRQRASYLFGYGQLGPAVKDGRMLPGLVVLGIEDAAGSVAAKIPLEEAQALYQRWEATKASIEGPGDDALPAADATWTDRQKISYLFGYLPLSQVVAESSLAVPEVGAGLRDGFAEVEAKVDPAATAEVFAAYDQLLRDERTAAQREAASAGKRYLEAKLAEDGVIATASGLLYEVLKPGEGPTPGPNEQVRVHYTGQLIDGTVFDSSEQRGEPAVFNVGRVIAGWTEGLQLMKAGARYRLHIPPDLGYGDAGSPPDIPPGAVLVFEVELLGIE